MTLKIVFPTAYFEPAMTELARGRQAFVRRPFGLNRIPESVEMLVRESVHLSANSRVLAMTSAASIPSQDDLESLLNRSNGDALLVIGDGENIGKIWGVAKSRSLNSTQKSAGLCYVGACEATVTNFV